MSDLLADVQVDARRLLCPMPVIRVQAAVRGMRAGQVLSVTATDPGVIHDIPAWCRVQGHEFLGSELTGLEICLWLRVGAP